MNKESSQILHIKGVDGAEINVLVDFSGQMLVCQNNTFNIKLSPASEKCTFWNKNTWRTAWDLCSARPGLIQLKVNTKETAKEQHPALPPLCSYTTHASDEHRPLSGPVEASSPVHWNAVVLSEHTRLFILRLCPAEKLVRQPHPWHLVLCLLRLNQRLFPTALSSHNSQK